MAVHSSRALVRPFAHLLLSVDLPGLGGSQRDEVADFAVRHVDELPSVLRIGTLIIAAPMRVVVAAPGARRLLAWLIAHPIPLIGEYVRMVRSLAYTYIWETWPHTRPDGSAAR